VGFCNVWVCVCVVFVMCAFCNVWVFKSVGVYMWGFAMCGCVSVWVFLEVCGCFGNIHVCTCIYCVACCLYSFHNIPFIYVYYCLFCLYWCKEYCHKVKTQLQ
jgi:hypothetical protein